MNRRAFIRNLIAGKPVEGCGLWIGSPKQATIDMLNRATGTEGEEALHRYFDDDIRWITPQYMRSTYQHPGGIPMRYWKDVNPHAMAGGLLAGARSVSDVDSLNWPDLRFLHFEETLERLEKAGDVYRLSGFWSPFFHDLTYLFGTEELLIKMLVEPELVHRALERLCNFYLGANELFYQQSTGLTDALFFGNDFGAQNDLLMAPEQFEEFFLPWIEKFTGQAHRFNQQVVLHSCGSVYRIMDRLIEAGVDGIHPIQSKAANMDAEYLAQHYKGKIAFVGGIDTQDVLPNGSQESVYNEVIRVKNLLGNNIVIGPSHEALLPNVPFENVKAMCDAARARTILQKNN